MNCLYLLHTLILALIVCSNSITHVTKAPSFLTHYSPQHRSRSDLAKHSAQESSHSKILLHRHPHSILRTKATPHKRPTMHPPIQPDSNRTPTGFRMPPSLRMTTVPLHRVSAEAPVEVIRRVCAEAVPAVGADSAGLFLRLVDLVLQLRGAGVNELELGELGVEDADDLC